MRRICLCATSIALVSSFLGCAEESPTPMGSIGLALVGQAPSGARYRLREGSIVVAGPVSSQYFDTELDPDRVALSARVPVGDYRAFLQDGWYLERLDPSGAVRIEDAEYVSSNPVEFMVAANRRSVVPLRFRVGDEPIDMTEGDFDIIIEVEEGEPSAGDICATDADCADGQTCCVAGFLGTCVEVAEGEACPLPDLTVDVATTAGSFSLGHRTISPDSCAIAEGCVGGSGARRLLSFSTLTPNLGATDMVLGDPEEVPGFVYSECQNDYQVEGYAAYELLDEAGVVVASGRKNVFCLLDSRYVGGPGIPDSQPSYTCGFQGIQRGWADLYSAGLECQWVDITGLPGGNYSLRITINPDQTLPESDYSNNVATIPVSFGDDVPPDPAEVVAPCVLSDADGADRNCGFTVAPAFEGASCEPGETVIVGCACGNGTCEEDPVMRVCEGAGPCLAADALLIADDYCALCPQGSFICPPSGTYTVLSAAYTDGDPYVCEPAVVSPTTP